MDTFGRLPTDVLLLIKEFYQTPEFDIEYIFQQDLYNFNNFVKIYLILKINTIVTKFILFESFDWFNIIKLRIYNTHCDELITILNTLQLIINNLKNNNPFILPCCLEFELSKTHIIFKYENFEVVLQNNEQCRDSLINALNKCYHYIKDKKYI